MINNIQIDSVKFHTYFGDCAVTVSVFVEKIRKTIK